jgi:hypothetical protein
MGQATGRGIDGQEREALRTKEEKLKIFAASEQSIIFAPAATENEREQSEDTTA